MGDLLALLQTDKNTRDGLMLDASTVQIGPYLQTWPPGLVLELVLQGDVVQRSSVVRPPLAATKDDRDDAPARLRNAARVLTLLQLDALAERCRRVAAAGQATEVELAAMHGAIRRTGAFAAIPAGLGACRIADAPTEVRSRLQSWLVSGKPSGHAFAQVGTTLDDLFYECEGCKVVMGPLAGDCCVFCSYGSTACPPKQLDAGGCCWQAGLELDPANPVL